MRRAVNILEEALRTARQLAPGEAPRTDNTPLRRGEPRDPENGVRMLIRPVDGDAALRFTRETVLRLENAAEVLSFSDETVLIIPREVSQAVEPELPVGHLLSPEEIAEHAREGLAVNADALVPQGFTFGMFMQPGRRTEGGGVAAWNSQEPHFHEGLRPFHDHRYAHGLVPPGVKAIFAHESGATVVAGPAAFALRIGRRDVHQFTTVLADGSPPELEALLRESGPLQPDSIRRVQELLDTHREVPGVAYESLSREQRAQASVLVVPTHTWDPNPTGAEKENLMAEQTVAVDPRRHPNLMPWSAPSPQD